MSLMARNGKLAGAVHSVLGVSESLVKLYRLCIIDPRSDRVDHERQFMANDHATAVWISEGIRHSRAMVLWNGSLKVHSWKAIGAGTGPSARPNEPHHQPRMLIR